VNVRVLAAIGLLIWLAVGLYVTLQPIELAPGQVVDNNFILFRTIGIYLDNIGSSFWMGQVVGNLLLLLPVGLLGPIALPAMSGWIRVFLVALGISATIEVAQLWITNRSADVDDVLINVTGALLGYAILTIARLGSGPRRALAEHD